MRNNFKNISSSKIQQIFIIIGILLFINGISLFFRSGFSNTFILNAGLFFVFALYAVLFDQMKRIIWLNCSIVVIVCLYAILGIFAMAYGRQDSATFQEDIAIVLGTGLRGEDVSPTLQNRLDMAVEFHHMNPDAFIIVSGGLGHGQIISEALAMSRYLVANNVPQELIMLEGYSHSTYQNMHNSMALVRNMVDDGVLMYVPQNVVVITNDFHIFRSVRFAKMAGFENVTSLHGNTPLIVLPGALVREVAAIVKMWVIGT